MTDTLLRPAEPYAPAAGRRKKILYIEANRDNTVGGSYYSLLYLVSNINKELYEPHVLFCQDNFLVPEFRNITPYVYINNYGPSASNPVEGISDALKWPYRLLTKVLLKQSAVNKIIKEIKPDLVHLNNGYAALHEWMLACRLNGIRIVAHDRGTRYPCTFQTRLFVRFLDAIVSVSESYKENVLKQHLKPGTVKRVYNGLDPARFVKGVYPKAAERTHKELGLKKGQFVVGMLGNIDRWKGQHVLLQAINILKDRHPDLRCLVVGKPVLRAEGYMEELKAFVSANGLGERVIFTGFRADVANLLSLFDVLVHASIEPEPFGRVLLEGMALGKPIIATDAGGPAEIIVNGETGLLVPMNDHRAMANAIEVIAGELFKAKEMGRRGQERLASTFSIEKTTREIEALYEELFNGALPRARARQS